MRRNNGGPGIDEETIDYIENEIGVTRFSKSYATS